MATGTIFPARSTLVVGREECSVYSATGLTNAQVLHNAAMRKLSTLGILLTLAITAGDANLLEGQSRATQKYALLVGVTTYPNLRGRDLAGPENDVVLIRSLLEGQRFQIPSANITSLAGFPAQQTRRPTKANILRELETLGRTVGDGDQVFILLAGHGSQQPDKGEKDDDEPDGLDEVFLPADAANWNRDNKEVTNAVTDDELRRALEVLTRRGAFVSLVVDSCQSGTMARGYEVSRQIPIEALVPEDEIAVAFVACSICAYVSAFHCLSCRSSRPFFRYGLQVWRPRGLRCPFRVRALQIRPYHLF